MLSWHSDFNGTRLSQQIIRLNNLSTTFEKWVLNMGDVTEPKSLAETIRNRFQHDSKHADFCGCMVH